MITRSDNLLVCCITWYLPRLPKSPKEFIEITLSFIETSHSRTFSLSKKISSIGKRLNTLLCTYKCINVLHLPNGNVAIALSFIDNTCNPFKFPISTGNSVRPQSFKFSIHKLTNFPILLDKKPILFSDTSK